ncbi:myeloid differentiation primary response protein MyD88-B-like [Asbolus verrucosus]|uniref:Myeloid differentiation primary response protein MyD88-B-like n=1 Tax=Asbolus verrucosus TaxID=1661398 RepID=A0A482VEU1_ASBVE|nr:myeloid differentiation primary response protein MyD88-B-like [Asbolus verrucosus]
MQYRNWRGLAALCDIDPSYLDSIGESSDPTDKVLNRWYEKAPDCSTIQQLQRFLEEMDRFDVIEDIKELIDEDIKIFETKPYEIRPPNLNADKYIITTDDVLRINEGRPLEIYDAFVLYDQDDIDFAIQLLDTMEKEYGMKFCVKDRDLVGGGLEMDKMIKLITERCKRLIVILSDSFFKSSANQYYLRFAHAYGIESERKIIPCKYKDCNLPPEMRYLFTLDHRRMGVFNFWDKLRDSLRVGDVEKCRVNRSHSDTNENLRSALHESYSNGLKPLNHGVKFSNSVGDLNNLETTTDLTLSPNTSADNLRPFVEKKEKKNWFKKILSKNNTKKDQTKIQNDVVGMGKEKKKGFSKHIKRRAAAVAN